MQIGERLFYTKEPKVLLAEVHYRDRYGVTPHGIARIAAKTPRYGRYGVTPHHIGHNADPPKSIDGSASDPNEYLATCGWPSPRSTSTQMKAHSTRSNPSSMRTCA